MDVCHMLNAGLEPTSSPRVLRILRFGHLLAIVLGTGWWVSLLGHRSSYPQYLGRYSADWMLLMGMVAALVAVLGLCYRKTVHKWVWDRRGRFLLAGVSVFATVCISELGTRVYMSRVVSPYYWRWGTAHAMHLVLYGNTNSHTQVREGYFKFPPNQVLHQGTCSHRLPTRINNLGFRGPDIAASKPPGTIRVLCLGASSTFGYTARDEGTYPMCLERKLNENAQPGEDRFEVINLGIPHLDSTAITHLFAKEAVPLNPDIVVLYSGTADTPFVPVRRATAFGQVFGWINQLIGPRVLLWHLVTKSLKKPYFYSTECIEQNAADAARTFIQNVGQLARWCRDHDVLFIPVTQQHSSLYGVGLVEELGHTTYEQECAGVRRAIRQTGGTQYRCEAFLLVHQALMERLRGFTQERGLALVDGIAALDDHRSLMRSWVHLSELANAILADAIAGEIQRAMPVRSASGGKKGG